MAPTGRATNCSQECPSPDPLLPTPPAGSLLTPVALVWEAAAPSLHDKHPVSQDVPAWLPC